jgi:ribosomal protein S18 acetylase RimI-like enzyme
MNLHDNREFTLTEVKKWFVNLGDKGYMICLSPVEEDKIGYFRFEFKKDDNLQVGLDLHPLYQGVGFGTSLYNCLIKHWKYLSPIKKLSLRVLTNNYVAKKLYLNNGFEVKCINIFNRGNEILEECYMELDINDK